MSQPDTFCLALLVEAYACNARIAGMTAENLRDTAGGYNITYGREDFQHEASTLAYISTTLRERAG